MESVAVTQVQRLDVQSDALVATPKDVTPGDVHTEPEMAVASATASHRMAYSGACIRTLAAHDGPVNCVVGLCGGLIASGGEDTLVKLWNASDGRSVRTLTVRGMVEV